MLEKVKQFKVGILILNLILGVVTTVLAILCLANVKIGGDAGVVLKWIISIGIILAGLITLIIGIVKSVTVKVGFINNFVIGSVFTGVAIYLMTDTGNEIFNNVIGILVPMIVACFGTALFISAIVRMIRKEPTIKTVPALIVSVILIVLGVVFATLCSKNPNLVNVVWLLLGIGIIITSIGNLVLIGKKKSINNKDTIDAEVESEDKAE